MVSYQAKTDGMLVTMQKNEYNGNGKRILKKDGNQEESYYYQNETLLLTVSDSQLKDFYYLGNAGNYLEGYSGNLRIKIDFNYVTKTILSAWPK